MQIGNLTVEIPLFLAPMAGVTDWAFRTVCARLGAGVTVTEMVSSRALVYQDKRPPGFCGKTREASAGRRFSGTIRKSWPRAQDWPLKSPAVTF